MTGDLILMAQYLGASLVHAAAVLSFGFIATGTIISVAMVLSRRKS